MHIEHTEIAGFEDAQKVLLQRALGQPSRYMLERMRRMMDFLGNPQDELRVIHVAGTSGKTSTCYYIASLLCESGQKVGLSVSPYVHNMNERVQINMTPLEETAFCRELSRFLHLIEKSNIELTYFEILTAFMYWEFARLKLDWVVVEVGLGGELDATNVVGREGKVCVITDIGLDHQDVLGDSIAEIAKNKAGIIQQHNKVIARKQDEEVMEVIRDRCRRRQADLLAIDQDDLPGLGFLPLFQKRNFELASAVYDSLAERNLAPGLDTGKRLNAAHASIPARMETFTAGGKTVILDGAHNPQKLRALVDSVRNRYPGQPVAVLAAFKASRSRRDRVEGSTAELVKIADHIIATSYGDPAGAQPHGEDAALVAAMCKIHGFAEVESIDKPEHAWHQLLARPEPILLVTGSFYLLSDIYPLLSGDIST